MEEIKKEITVGYKSFDGEIFDSSDECTKYEKSCIGIIKSKLLPYIAQKLLDECNSGEWLSETTLEQYIERLNSLIKPKDNADSNSNTVQ